MLLSITLPPNRLVEYRGVPIYRGLMWALYDAQMNGAAHVILSGDRRRSTLLWFNKRYRTSLHSQEWCISMHAKDPVHYAPANPVDQTSHCLRGDGNHAYGPKRGYLPWYKLGLDLLDYRARNDCSKLAARLRELGYSFVQPYTTGAERHHGSFLKDPSALARKRLAKQLAKPARPETWGE